MIKCKTLQFGWYLLCLLFRCRPESTEHMLRCPSMICQCLVPYQLSALQRFFNANWHLNQFYSVGSDKVPSDVRTVMFSALSICLSKTVDWWGTGQGTNHSFGNLLIPVSIFHYQMFGSIFSFKSYIYVDILYNSVEITLWFSSFFQSHTTCAIWKYSNMMIMSPIETVAY